MEYLHKRKTEMKKQIVLKTIILILIGTLVLILISTLFNRNKNAVSFSPSSDIIGVIPPLRDEEMVQQIFIPTTDTITEIQIQIGTYERTNHFMIEVGLSEVCSGTNLLSQEIDASELVDNEFEVISFSPISVKRGEPYVITFQTKGASNDNTVTFYRTNELAEGEKNYVCIDGEQQAYNLSLYVLGYNTILNVFAAIILGAILVVVVSETYFLYVRKIKPEILFTMLAFLLGVLYLFVITPFSVPDEGHHYQSAYQLSNFFLLRSDKSNYGDSMDFDYSEFVGHINVASGYMRVIEEITNSGDKSSLKEELIEIPQPRDLSYFIEYIPQALGISIARITHQNFVRTFMMGRLFNLLFYTICFFFSIRIIPRFKVMLGIIGIMPMLLHQVASLSYDSFVNGMSFLLIALLIKAIHEEGALPPKMYICITTASILLAPAKIVYAFLLLPILLIPNSRFGGRKKKILFIILDFIASIFFIVLFQGLTLNNFANQSPNTTTCYTLGFILGHPFQTISIFAKTIWNCIDGWLLAAMGSSLSGATLSIPVWIPFGFILIIVLSTLGHDIEKVPFLISTSERIVFLIAALFVLLLVMTSQFLAYTPNDYPMVYGVQGRYFIPIIPLLALSISNQTIVLKRNIDKPLVLTAVLLNAATIISILDYTL